MSGIDMPGNYKYLVQEVKRVWGLDGADIFQKPDDFERNIYCSLVLNLGSPNTNQQLFEKLYDLASNTLPMKELISQKDRDSEYYKKQISELEERVKYLENFKVHYDLEFQLRHGKGEEK